MEDLSVRLSHVLWIGGGPCVGKTTLARLLAGKYDLRVYEADWHHANEHGLRPGGFVPGWDDSSMDERWVLPTPSALAERDVVSWSRRFECVVDDLLATNAGRTVVAEGPTLFPWNVAQVIRSPRQAIFLLPTDDWRERVIARKHRGASAASIAARTTDPRRARRNILERDILMAAWIANACDEFGLRAVRVDGSAGLDATLALLEEHFAELLPSTLNV